MSPFVFRRQGEDDRIMSDTAISEANKLLDRLNALDDVFEWGYKIIRSDPSSDLSPITAFEFRGTVRVIDKEYCARQILTVEFVELSNMDIALHMASAANEMFRQELGKPNAVVFEP